MAQHKTKVVTDTIQLTSNGGKLIGVSIAVTGDIVWTFHKGTADTDPLIYKVSTALTIPHDNIHTPFSKLYIKKASGTTGQINVIYES